ncbi:MAG: carotenoid biosynthesis protein [Oscillatoriales cyanobacterium SM2_2_1]|nr:carotenoid biosynthesis protein [Oscillatoriales cyanobacterium SM2_2_1]
MKRIIIAQWVTLGLHLAAMLFGLIGLLFVLPNAAFIESLSDLGLQIFALGMQGGGASYMILGTIATCFYGWQTLGGKTTALFFFPAVLLSLGCELLGTSTGFPFGAYSYLSGLGYKIADLVPFTIPLSWFYMGFVSLLLAHTTLRQGTHWLQRLEAIALGAMMLTSWDFVLDPAMSQTRFPFWEWHQFGAFFGMPLQNFAGWMGTGVLFMTVSTLLWGKAQPPLLNQKQLLFPILMYSGNFLFSMLLSYGGGIYPPILLGILLGIAPAVGLWLMAPREDVPTADALIDARPLLKV